MKKSFMLALAVMAFSGTAFAGTPSEDLNDVLENTKAFDGGDGSTINTTVDDSRPFGSDSE